MDHIDPSSDLVMKIGGLNVRNFFNREIFSLRSSSTPSVDYLSSFDYVSESSQYLEKLANLGVACALLDLDLRLVVDFCVACDCGGDLLDLDFGVNFLATKISCLFFSLKYRVCTLGVACLGVRREKLVVDFGVACDCVDDLLDLDFGVAYFENPFLTFDLGKNFLPDLGIACFWVRILFFLLGENLVACFGCVCFGFGGFGGFGEPCLGRFGAGSSSSSLTLESLN
jgi:hypothetical protein